MRNYEKIGMKVLMFHFLDFHHDFLLALSPNPVILKHKTQLVIPIYQQGSFESPTSFYTDLKLP
jgi:hypothetical protein